MAWYSKRFLGGRERHVSLSRLSSITYHHLHNNQSNDNDDINHSDTTNNISVPSPSEAADITSAVMVNVKLCLWDVTSWNKAGLGNRLTWDMEIAKRSHCGAESHHCRQKKKNARRGW